MSIMPQCGNCRKYAHSNGLICPTGGVECNKYGRINHYVKVCRSKITAQAFNGTEYKPYQQSSQQPKASLQRYRKQDVSQNYTPSNSFVPKQNSKRRDTVRKLESVPANKDLDEYAEFLRYKASNEFGLFSLKQQTRLNDDPRTTVNIRGSGVSCLVDSCLPVNVVDVETFRSLEVSPILDKCNTRYYGYTAKNTLPILGQFTKRIERKGKSVRAGFMVIKVNAECLWSNQCICQPYQLTQHTAFK